MVDQLELLRIVVEALESLGIRYAIVGSYASGAWGEARFTKDIDIAGMLKVSGDRIDRAYIAHWAEKLRLTDIWHAILRRLGEEVPPPARGH